MFSTTERLSPARRRWRGHVRLMSVSLAITLLVVLVDVTGDVQHRFSMGTAYASLALLVYGITLGPRNVLRGRPNPVSTNLRRDAGIWAGAFGLLHVVFGLQVHLRGKMLEYFVDPSSRHAVPVRLDAFGLANYTGLVAALILVLLLALSNDVSLRSLGTRRWKTLQRANYVGMLLTIAHGAVYQVLEKRPLPFVILFALQLAFAVRLQLAGFRRVARERGAGRD